MKTWPALSLGVIAAAACRSSAPYTIPAAAINSAVAVGFSARSRAAGSCWATCTGGTLCNPTSGLCEQPPMARPDGRGRCVAWDGLLNCTQRVETEGRVGGSAPALGGLGLSPATGAAPSLPPAKSSIEGP